MIGYGIVAVLLLGAYVRYVRQSVSAQIPYPETSNHSGSKSMSVPISTDYDYHLMVSKVDDSLWYDPTSEQTFSEPSADRHPNLISGRDIRLTCVLLLSITSQHFIDNDKFVPDVLEYNGIAVETFISAWHWIWLNNYGMVVLHKRPGKGQQASIQAKIIAAGWEYFRAVHLYRVLRALMCRYLEAFLSTNRYYAPAISAVLDHFICYGEMLLDLHEEFKLWPDIYTDFPVYKQSLDSMIFRRRDGVY